MTPVSPATYLPNDPKHTVSEIHSNTPKKNPPGSILHLFEVGDSQDSDSGNQQDGLLQEFMRITQEVRDELTWKSNILMVGLLQRNETPPELNDY